MEAVKPKEGVINALNTKDPFACTFCTFMHLVGKMNPNTLVHSCHQWAMVCVNYALVWHVEQSGVPAACICGWRSSSLQSSGDALSLNSGHVSFANFSACQSERESGCHSTKRQHRQVSNSRAWRAPLQELWTVCVIIFCVSYLNTVSSKENFTNLLSKFYV